MPVTFWITKHALSRGIEKAEGCELSHDGSYAVRGRHGNPDHLYEKIGREAFRTEDEAKVRGIELVKAKLAAIAREQDKLNDLLIEWAPAISAVKPVKPAPAKTKKK